MTTRILAKPIPESRRLAALRAAFRSPLIASLVETTAFNVLSRLSVSRDDFDKVYRGGYWEYVRLSNDGFFMYPTADAQYRLFCDGNGACEVLQAQHAGIVATLFSLSGMACRYPNQEVLAERYYQLLEYVDTLPARDRDAIKRLCD